MPFNRAAHLAHASVFRRHHTTEVAQRVEERVEAANVIEQQEGDRAIAVARLAKLFEQLRQGVKDRFRLTGGSRAEEDQSGLAPRAQCLEQGMAAMPRLSGDGSLIAIVDVDPEIEFRDLCELFVLVA